MKSLLLLFLSSIALASQVTHTGVTLRHLLVSQDPGIPFLVDDYLCVVQHQEEVACGFVEKIEGNSALVDLEFRSEDVAIGSFVQRATTRRPCDPEFVFRPLQDPRTETPLMDPYSRKCTPLEKDTARKFRVRAPRYFSVGLGITHQFLAAETSLSNAFSMGLNVSLQSFSSLFPSYHATAAGTAYGGSLFIAYYPQNLFEHFFVQFGIGYFQGRMNLREDLNTWSGTSLGVRIGYRLLNWQGFGVGLSLNAQHFSFKNAESPTRTEFLYPGLHLEFGGAF